MVAAATHEIGHQVKEPELRFVGRIGNGRTLEPIAQRLAVELCAAAGARPLFLPVVSQRSGHESGGGRGVADLVEEGARGHAFAGQLERQLPAAAADHDVLDRYLLVALEPGVRARPRR
jgi:hypothetical protein